MVVKIVAYQSILTMHSKAAALLNKELPFLRNQTLLLLITFAVAIVIRVAFTFRTFTLSPDISVQLHTLKNLYNGLGITVTIFSEGKLIQLPYADHPPGLVLATYPFYCLFKDVIYAAYAINLVSDLLILMFVFRTLALFNYSPQSIAIRLLLFSFLVSPFYTCWPSDYLATAFAIWAFYFSLRGATEGKKLDFTISIMLAGLSYFIKYSFLPFLLSPLVIYLIFCFLKRKINSKNLLIITISTVLMFVLVGTINRFLVGTSAQSSVTTNGLYFSNLLKFDGLLAHFGTYDLKLDRKIKLVTGQILNFHLVSLLITGASILLLLYVFFRSFKSKKDISPEQFLSILTVTSLVLIVPFLTLLSLLSPPLRTDNNWTYVETTRYYSPAIVLFSVFLLTYLLTKKQEAIKKIVLVIFMLLNLVALRSFLRTKMYGADLQTCKRKADLVIAHANALAGDKEYFISYSNRERFCEEFYILNANGIPSYDISKSPVTSEMIKNRVVLPLASLK